MDPVIISVDVLIAAVLWGTFLLGFLVGFVLSKLSSCTR